MTRSHASLCGVVLVLFCHSVTQADDAIAWARQATSPDRRLADAAITRLRAAGPVGLEAMFGAYSTELASRDAAAEQVRDAIDRVAAQKDAWASRLYWYTDFAQAQRAAEAQGKPILTLRLLGRLDEELSCANSRFFRTTLYANKAVSDHLRDHFVLHWSSVRPAPVITIDYGDGHVLRRTITGNSIHYVLDSHGRVIDGLPGLLGPQAFLGQLRTFTSEAVARWNALDHDAMAAALQSHHARLLDQTRQRWTELAPPPPLRGIDAPQLQLTQVLATATVPDRGQLLTGGKRIAEMPMVEAVVPVPRVRAWIDASDEAWQAVAAKCADLARLDEQSVRLMVLKHGGGRSLLASIPPFVRRFEQAMALDTARNTFQLQPVLRSWIGSGSTVVLDDLNRRVYAELFLTPDNDPWLGLNDPDIYTGLLAPSLQ